MRFTVLGASGFIGSALVSYLEQEGHEVLTPERGASPDLWGDLGHLVYCIGLTADFRTRPFDTLRAHVCVLAEWLEKGAFRSFLYLSSTRVYQGLERGWEGARLRVDPENPSDLYNISKLAGEGLCLDCGRPGTRVARLANVVGEDWDSSNFLTDLLKEARKGKITLLSHPDSAKDYILLDDVVPLLARIAQEGKRRIYNVASGRNLSHRTLIRALQALTGCEVSLDTRAPLQSFPPIDVHRIRDEFGFRPDDVLGRLPVLLARLGASRPASGAIPPISSKESSP